MNKANLNFEKIDNPYDYNLNRANSDIFSMGGQKFNSEGLPSVDASESKSSDSKQGPGAGSTPGGNPTVPMQEDLWISNWIKSRNYKPKSQGFLIDGRLGYIECMKLYVGTGGIVGGKIDIPDTVSANSFHTDELGNSWWGSASQSTAVAKILKTGVATFTAVNISGLQPGSQLDGTYILANTIGSAAAKIALQSWTTNIVFTSDSATQVSWASGSIVLADGTAYSIVAGNTSSMTERVYIYLDINVSITVLQASATASDAVGEGKLMIATAVNDTVAATFQVFGGGGSFVGADNIAANAVTANKISVSNLSAISANLGTITAANVTVGASGWLRGGQTDYNTGIGFFLGSSGGAYKFSIGDPSGNYMTWDNSYLRIKGNFELASVLNMISFTVANLPIPPSTAGYNNPGGWE